MRISWSFVVVIAAFPVQAGNLCDDPVTTIEINQCGQSDYQIVDEKLNAAYQAALHRIQSELPNKQQQSDIKQELTEAQRLWVRFRDKDCGAVYDLFRYGTKAEIRDSMYWGCMIKRTEQRTQELESFGIYG